MLPLLTSVARLRAKKVAKRHLAVWMLLRRCEDPGVYVRADKDTHNKTYDNHVQSTHRPWFGISGYRRDAVRIGRGELWTGGAMDGRTDVDFVCLGCDVEGCSVMIPRIRYARRGICYGVWLTAHTLQSHQTPRASSCEPRQDLRSLVDSTPYKSRTAMTKCMGHGSYGCIHTGHNESPRGG